jgi:hypothetical protein
MFRRFTRTVSTALTFFLFLFLVSRQEKERQS